MTTGLLAALRAAGHTVAPFKVGPDYIDPGYHTLAAGRPGRNLDAVMCGEHRIAPLLAHGFCTPEPADVALIEGVMGLFDGRLGDGVGSSAHIAALTKSPVVLVIDTAHASLTHAAVAAGLAHFDPQVRIAGVILNRVASPRHAAEIRRGLDLAGLPVLGEIPRNPDIFVPSRHLGLVPAAERAESARQVEQLAQFIGGHVDLTALLRIAEAAPQLDAQPWDPAAALAGTGIEIPGASPDRTSSDRTPASSTPLQLTPHQPGQARSTEATGRPVVAMAGGRAFTFRYPETAELLEASGLEVVDVDPLTAPALPQGCCGLYLGGGFPEVHATELSANTSLHDDIRRRAAEGMPIIAECAGLLYLCRHLDGHDMASVLPLDGAMNRRLTMGYRTATAPADTLVAQAGDQVIGHEFHRTQVVAVDAEPPRDTDSARTSDDAPQDSSQHSTGLHSSGVRPDTRPVTSQPSSTAEPAPLPAAWTFPGRDGVVSDGVSHGSVHASYLHLHWAGTPHVAARFAKAVWQYAQRPRSTEEPIAVDHSPADTGAARPDATSRAGGHANRCRQALPAGDVDTASTDRPTGAAAPELVQPGEATSASRDESAPAAPTATRPAVQESAPPPPAVEPDLRHHGDQDVRQGLIDLAVNVRVQQTPVWLINAIVSTGNWAHYPDPSAARNALAAMHQVPRQMLLPTSGGAEGFTLIAHALHPEHPLVVHPQFTEPESALIQAGFQVARLILDRANGFQLAAEDVPDDADLVVVGNPTNPTGRLHPREVIARLRRPGRVVVVDEAFMDATDEAESMIGPHMDGVLVLRSLTKTYGLAGVRAGYVVGDPALIERLAAQQPPWSVSTPAAAAMVAVTGDLGRAHRLDLARTVPGQRDDLVRRLTDIGLPPIDSGAPFVLLDTSSISPQSIRPALESQGIAVRRGETFPGLGPTWIRLAVRDCRIHTRLAEALGAIQASPSDFDLPVAPDQHTS